MIKENSNTEQNPVYRLFFSVGNKVYFEGEKLPYKVMAVSKRYAVVSRPLNRRQDARLLHDQVEMRAYTTFTSAFKDNKKNPVYSLIDFEDGVRAQDDLVFGIYDYFDEKQCQEVIRGLESGEIKLSSRNRCKLSVDVNRTKIYRQPRAKATL